MFYLIIAAGVFLTDFLLKSHIEKKYRQKSRRPCLRGKIILEKYYNRGAALNLLSKRPIFLKVLHTSVLFAIGVCYYFVLRRNGHIPAKLGGALLLGGGLNNLWDRYTKGYVVDYFRIDIGPKWFRRIIFNISDFFIFIGALLCVCGSDAIGKED